MKKKVLITIIAVLSAFSISACMQAKSAPTEDFEFQKCKTGTNIAQQSSDISASSVEVTSESNNSLIEIPEATLLSTTEAAVEASDIEVYNLSMMAVGDDLIHSGIYKDAAMPDGSYNFDFIFENLKDEIASYDLSVINQETILIDDYSMVSSYPCFGTPSSIADSIASAGFDVVLSATNHTWDKRSYGVDTTLAYWANNYPDMTVLGIHDSEEDYNTIDIVEANGISLAMFNYTYGLNGFTVPSSEYYKVDLLDNKEKFINDLKVAENMADMSICFLHIGTEYTYTPTSYQTNYINDLIDAGADIIVCAHPHVIEPFGMVQTTNGNSALVYYSCGNFISTQDEIPRLLGGMATFNIQKIVDGENVAVAVTEYEFTPLVTHYTASTHTTYKLTDYNDELSKLHRIRNKDSRFSTDYLWSIWTDVTGVDRTHYEQVN